MIRPMPASSLLALGPALAAKRAPAAALTGKSQAALPSPYAAQITAPHGTDVIPTQYRRDTDSGFCPAKSPALRRPSRAQSFTEMRP
ncbi:hypothetical protein NBRC116596_08440 [Litorivita sp. NS0012-18]